MVLPVIIKPLSVKTSVLTLWMLVYLEARGYRNMLEAISVDFENEPELAWGYYATRINWYTTSILPWPSTSLQFF